MVVTYGDRASELGCLKSKSRRSHSAVTRKVEHHERAQRCCSLSVSLVDQIIKLKYYPVAVGWSAVQQSYAVIELMAMML
jgi:hypothetical protein